MCVWECLINHPHCCPQAAGPLAAQGRCTTHTHTQIHTLLDIHHPCPPLNRSKPVSCPVWIGTRAFTCACMTVSVCDTLVHARTHTHTHTNKHAHTNTPPTHLDVGHGQCPVDTVNIDWNKYLVELEHVAARRRDFFRPPPYLVRCVRVRACVCLCVYVRARACACA